MVAEKHCIAAYVRRRSADPKTTDMPIMLKLRVDSWQRMGVDISSFSAFPNECEIVYPPCTYFEPKGERDETILADDGTGSIEEFTLKILEVVPQVA